MYSSLFSARTQRFILHYCCRLESIPPIFWWNLCQKENYSLIFLDIYIARENEEAWRKKKDKNLPLFFAFVQRVLLDEISNLSKNNCMFLKHFLDELGGKKCKHIKHINHIIKWKWKEIKKEYFCWVNWHKISSFGISIKREYLLALAKKCYFWKKRA